MTEQKRVIDTFGGRFVLALVGAIGITAIVVAAVDPVDLPENCRMVGKVQKCTEPSPTPSETSWRIDGDRYGTDGLYGTDGRYGVGDRYGIGSPYGTVDRYGSDHG